MAEPSLELIMKLLQEMQAGQRAMSARLDGSQ
jgi:hypothetical protein